MKNQRFIVKSGALAIFNLPDPENPHLPINNEPLTKPHKHADKILYHSDFEYLELEKTLTWNIKYPTRPYFPGNGTINLIEPAAHPNKFMVAYDGEFPVNLGYDVQEDKKRSWVSTILTMGDGVITCRYYGDLRWEKETNRSNFLIHILRRIPKNNSSLFYFKAGHELLFDGGRLSDTSKITRRAKKGDSISFRLPSPQTMDAYKGRVGVAQKNGTAHADLTLTRPYSGNFPFPEVQPMTDAAEFDRTNKHAIHIAPGICKIKGSTGKVWFDANHRLAAFTGESTVLNIEMDIPSPPEERIEGKNIYEGNGRWSYESRYVCGEIPRRFHDFLLFQPNGQVDFWTTDVRVREWDISQNSYINKPYNGGFFLHSSFSRNVWIPITTMLIDWQPHYYLAKTLRVFLKNGKFYARINQSHASRKTSYVSYGSHKTGLRIICDFRIRYGIFDL